MTEETFERMLEEAAVAESDVEVFAIGCRMCGGMGWHESTGWEEAEMLEHDINRRERLKFNE